MKWKLRFGVFFSKQQALEERRKGIKRVPIGIVHGSF